MPTDENTEESTEEPAEENQRMPTFFQALSHSYRATSSRRQLSSERVKDIIQNATIMEPLIDGVKDDNLRMSERKSVPVAITKSDAQQLILILQDNWLNLLLFASIPAIIAQSAGWSDGWIFTLNFLVMIPLASLLGDLTEIVAGHLGESIGGVINATFGNAVELIVVIIAIRAGHIRIVQASLMGSIFSNVLLVLGCAMLVAGRHAGVKEVRFNALGACVPALMLLVSNFIIMVNSIQAVLNPTEGDESAEVKLTARIGACVLIVIYIAYLVFSLSTHTEYFRGENEEDHEEELSLSSGLIGLAILTALVSIFSDFLVGSINGVCLSTGMSTTFLGVVLLPIIGNAVEHWTAVTCAYKSKMNLAISISLGSAAQISLFVLPVSVVVG